VALHLAVQRGLDFGRDVISTYGPLGFLHHPRFVTGSLFTLDFVYTAIVRLALGTLLVRCLRRSLPVAIAALVAWPIAAACSAQSDIALGAEPEVAVMVLLGLEALRATPRSWLRRTYPVVAGVAAAVLVLIKPDMGLVALGTGAVAVWATRRDGAWRIPAFVGSAVAAIAVLLAATRQGAPLDLLTMGLSVSSGFSSAMAYEQSNLVWQYAAAAASGVLILAAALSETGAWRPAVRTPVLVLLAFAGWVVFKEGFVRHDDHHAQIFFPIALAVAASFTWAGRRREPLLLSLVALGGFTLAAEGESLHRLLAPRLRVDAFVDSAKAVVSPGERAKLAARSRRDVTATAPISQRLLQRIGGGTVAVIPGNQAFVWAYRLNWRPVPVLQLLLGYTRKLDDDDRSFLASSRAPRFILDDGPFPVDGRYGRWDSPGAMLELLCRYRSVGVEGAWALLGRVPDRCGRSRALTTRRAWSGQFVRVPAPRSLAAVVGVRIHGLDVEGLEHLREFVFRARNRRVALDGGRRFRFLPGTATEAHLLWAPPGVDYPPPHDLAPQARTIAAWIAHGPRRRIRYEFFEVPVRPSGGSSVPAAAGGNGVARGGFLR
jgi:hypothetical protein